MGRCRTPTSSRSNTATRWATRPTTAWTFVVERRFVTGLTFRSSVTISRSIDNAPDQLNTNASFGQNGRDFKSWRGPSDFDVPRRWVTSYVYELPFGKGKRFATSGPLDYIVGGWQMSGGITFQD